MDIDWEDILVKLQAYTRSLTREGIWFRGSKTTTFLSGKEVDDYVYEAIGKYLKNREKFDPEKGDLLEYLKLNLIRSLVSNDLRKSENHVTNFISAEGDEEDEADNKQAAYSERLLRATEPLFTDEIDYNDVKEYIEQQIQGNDLVEKIFLGLYHYGLKRRAVITEFNMSAAESDNGVRRLNTVISRAASHFNPNKQKA
jgi:hypothetical protein